MKILTRRILASGLLLSASIAFSTIAQAKPNPKSQKVFDHWNAERIADAQPRDLYLDHRGLGYMKRKDGSLLPYGHSKKPELVAKKVKAVPRAKPGGNTNRDTTPPTIVTTSPADGATIAASQIFSATVTDSSGVKSVTFEVVYGGQTYTFDGVFTGNDQWETSVEGFSAGSGTWRIIATDNAKRGGNSVTSSSYSFTVDGTPPPPPPPSGDIVTNSRWTNGGAIQTSAGRLFYEMASKRGKRLTWAGYVCSGTVTTDSTTGRSVIITAAHCVYNDTSKTFARNVLFIPNQDQTSGSSTDSNCSNDPVGCWTASFGAVEQNWTTRTFPDNIPWDYAYYVVDDNGSHSGNGSSGALDSTVGSFDVSFASPNVNDGQAGPNSLDFTHGLGYSYSDDPYFMYCAEDMTTQGADNWWLSQCGLSGGSSGGPWVQPMNETSGSGPVISVNSWGYSNGSPGMAGPKLSGTTAECVFDAAKSASLSTGNNADGSQGIIISPNSCN